MPGPSLKRIADTVQETLSTWTGASTGPVPSGHTQVSRWISDAEVGHWHKGGGTTIPPEVSNAGSIFSYPTIC